MSHGQVFAVLLIVSCGYALARGGASERLGALICVVGSVASFLVQRPGPQRFIGLEQGVFLVDLLMLGAFVAIALRSRRFWPMWVAGILGTEVATHALGLAAVPQLDLTYEIAVKVTGYVVLPLIAIATYRHRRRIRLAGTDSSWLPSSSPWWAPMPKATPPA